MCLCANSGSGKGKVRMSCRRPEVPVASKGGDRLKEVLTIGFSQGQSLHVTPATRADIGMYGDHHMTHSPTGLVNMFGEFTTMFGAAQQDGRFPMLDTSRKTIEHCMDTIPGMPKKWIRIAGKNKSKLEKAHVKWVDEIPMIKKKIDYHLGMDSSQYGIIFEGDNFEDGPAPDQISPFSVLIGDYVKSGTFVVAIKNLRDGNVSKAFYNGWKDILTDGSNMYMMFVADPTGMEKEKERAAAHYSNLGTFFLGSGCYEGTAGYGQVEEMRKTGMYEEVSLDEDEPKCMLLFKPKA